MAQHGGAGGGQVPDEPALLRQLGANLLAGSRRELRLVVVAVDSGRHASVEQRLRAIVEQRADVGGIRPDADAREQHLFHVPLRERPLPGSDLEHRGLVLRARRRPDREADADRREEREGRQDRRDRAAAARGERPECLRPGHAYVTTSAARMPPR